MKQWDNPLHIGENVLPARAALHFPTRKRIDLNGEWLFSCEKGVQGEPQDFSAEQTLTGTIQVPGCWESQGYGKPYYFACGFPSCVHVEEGHIPEIENDGIYVGRYLRTFKTSSVGESKAVLHFGSVKSAFYCWLNGQYVGMGKGSMLPVEFDVTAFVQPGENRLAVQVYEFSDATYLEDQDMWHLAGICRDVWLEQRPKKGILDVFAQTAFDDNYRTAVLKVDVLTELQNGLIQAKLLRHGKELRCESSPVNEGRTTLQLDCGEVALWSAETPELYELEISCRTEDGQEESCWMEYGFREIRIDGERLLINGMPLKLRGVNYHAFTPDKGYYVPKETFEKDLYTMKLHNINAIRTSHYPQDEYFYTLCNRLGIYVMDECNVESHGVRDKNVPGNNSLWTPHVIDRMQRMVLRDRNHPCVVMWSLGNESDSGENHHKMRAAALALDPSRPIHYEGGADLQASDFVCVGYSSPEREKMFADGLDVPDRCGVVAEMDPNLMMSVNVITFDTYKNHPIVATEYMHSMGNSGSEMQMHTDVFENSDRWCGGFIWDFKDKALSLPDGPMGRKSYGYGGDFGPGDQPGTMCCNGVCDPAGIPHEQLNEVKKVYQPVWMNWDDSTKTLDLINRNSFLNLSWYDITWEVTRDGERISGGTLEIDCAPRERCTVQIPEAVSSQEPGCTMLTVTVSTRQDTEWAACGFVAAYDQWCLSDIPAPESVQSGHAVECPGGWLFQDGNTSYFVCAENGDVESVSLNGHNLLKTPLRPNFWRVPTDADLGFMGIVMQRDQQTDLWGDISLGTTKPVTVTCAKKDGSVEAVTTYDSGEKLFGTLTRTYRMTEAGLQVKATFVAEQPPRRFGLQAELSSDFDTMRWLGKGPHDTYWGREESGTFGWHEKSVLTQDEHMRPQEHGSKRGTKIVQYISNDAVVELRAAQGDFSAAAWPYTLEQLHKARHVGELPEYETTTILVDGMQNGLGDAFVKLKDDYKLKSHTPYTMDLILNVEERR